MDNSDKLFMIFIALYVVWQLCRVAHAVESISTELLALRTIAEQNRR